MVVRLQVVSELVEGFPLDLLVCCEVGGNALSERPGRCQIERRPVVVVSRAMRLAARRCTVDSATEVRTGRRRLRP